MTQQLPQRARLARALVVAVGVTLLVPVGCTGVDVPTEPPAMDPIAVDAQALSARIAQVEAVLGQPVLRRLVVAADAGPLASIAVPNRSGAGALLSRTARVMGKVSARATAAAAPDRRAAARLGVRAALAEPTVWRVPAEARGLTFTTDSLGGWVVALDAEGQPVAGAPVDGVRFLLRAAGADGLSTGAVEGHADVVERGDATSTGVELTVTRLDGTAVLSLVARAAHDGSTATHAGWVGDGERTITFHESYQPGAATSATLAYEAPFAQLAVRLAFTLRADGTMTLDFAATVEQTTVRIAATTDAEELAARVYVDDVLVLEGSSTAAGGDPVVYQYPGGHDVPATEILKVERVASLFGAVPDVMMATAVLGDWLGAVGPHEP